MSAPSALVPHYRKSQKLVRLGRMGNDGLSFEKGRLRDCKYVPGSKPTRSCIEQECCSRKCRNSGQALATSGLLKRLLIRPGSNPILLSHEVQEGFNPVRVLQRDPSEGEQAMCKIGKRYSNEQLLLLSAFVVALLVDTTRIASRQEDLPRLMRDPVAVNSRKSNSLDESFPRLSQRGAVCSFSRLAVSFSGGISFLVQDLVFSRKLRYRYYLEVKGEREREVCVCVCEVWKGRRRRGRGRSTW